VAACRAPECAIPPSAQPHAAAVLERAAMTQELFDCLLGCFTDAPGGHPAG
jgi:hypothetical protein